MKLLALLLIAACHTQDPTMLSLRYTGFFVHDVPATVRFYETAFGLSLRYMPRAVAMPSSRLDRR